MSRHIPRLALVVAMVALGAAVYAGTNLTGGGDDPSADTVGDLPVECGMEPATLTLEVVREIPHDTEAFTQGLTFRGDELFESTGQRGASQIRRLDPETGSLLSAESLDERYFAEGLSVVEGQLVQLTWTSGLAFLWETEGDAFNEMGTWSYDGEGWGLATDDDGMLLMSDGTDRLQRRDADSFDLFETLPVARVGGEVGDLNELEYVQGHLWANQWKSNEILRIRMDCGEQAVVDGVLDASALSDRILEVAGESAGGREPDVLNGIAHGGEGTYLLTGKYWPLMFEVTITEQQ